MVNYVIGVVNYKIAARPSLLNFVIADTNTAAGQVSISSLVRPLSSPPPLPTVLSSMVGPPRE